MSLSQLYYCEANATADDTTSAIKVTKSLLYAIKAFLMQQKTGTTGTSGAPPVGAAWSMYYSCDSVTAGTANDGVDRWGGGTFDATKLVRAAAGSAHSWAVLKSSGSICAALASTPFYLIIDWGTGADTTFNFLISKAAPTGGTTTARPTATDEVGLTNFVMTDVTVSTHRLFFVTDAVGNFLIMMEKAAAGFVHTFLAVQQLVAPGLQAADVFPMMIIADSSISGRGATSSAQVIGSAGFNGAAGATTRSPLNNVAPSTSTGTGLLVPVNTNWLTATTTNQGNSKTDALPVQMMFVGAATTAVKGTIPDWYVSNSANSVGTCEPASGSLEHMNIGNFWVPCGGVTPTL